MKILVVGLSGLSLLHLRIADGNHRHPKVLTQCLIHVDPDDDIDIVSCISPCWQGKLPTREFYMPVSVMFCRMSMLVFRKLIRRFGDVQE